MLKENWHGDNNEGRDISGTSVTSVPTFIHRSMSLSRWAKVCLLFIMEAIWKSKDHKSSVHPKSSNPCNCNLINWINTNYSARKTQVQVNLLSLNAGKKHKKHKMQNSFILNVGRKHVEHKNAMPEHYPKLQPTSLTALPSINTDRKHTVDWSCKLLMT